MWYILAHFLEESKHEGRQKYILTLILSLFNHSIDEELRNPIHKIFLLYRLLFELMIQLQALLDEWIHFYWLESLLVVVQVDSYIAIVDFTLLIPYNFIVRHIIENFKEQSEARLFLFVFRNILVDYLYLLVFK